MPRVESVLVFALPEPAATQRLAAALARLARPGDVIALQGGLGAGKTTFARGFIQSLASDVEVPSPTFNLVLTYETSGATIWHFDLYRIEAAGELRELGLEEAFADGISLVEWPERLGPWQPEETVTVALEIGKAAQSRQAQLTGRGGWPARLRQLEFYG